MTITPLRTMTVEEHLALPEGEELRHAEFIDGEVIVLVDAPRLVEAPLLAVEVLSPDSVIRDLVDERDEYAAAGLEHYLVARPYDTPALWYFRRDGDVLREQAYVLGPTPLTLPEPFRPGVPLVPAELVRP